MDIESLRRLLEQQCGVVARNQLIGLGGRKHDLDRLVRRRELARVHPGVYVDHTGPLSWEQRTWAAVLYAGPGAALCLESAMPSPCPEGVIHVAVDAARRVADRDRIRVHRVRGLCDRVQWNSSPPRVRLEDTVLELAHRCSSTFDVIRLLSDALGHRRTTPARLRAALRARSRTARRRWIERVLDDLEHGACSVLEHGYLVRVERAHGLPRAQRQSKRRTPQGSEYRDADYCPYGLVVELDGRLGHDSFAGGGRDADRDLDDQAAGHMAVRLRWAQVFDRPCRTADRIGLILRRRGWTGELHRCGPDCALP